MNLPVNYTTLTPQERQLVREEYIHLQNGKCSHCGTLLSGDAAPKILKKK